MHSFDIDIGMQEPTYSADQLLRLAQDAVRRGDHASAQGYLERANCSQGMVHYAAYLMDHRLEHMEAAQQMSKIEQLLLYVERNSPVAAPKARAMLINFYHRFRNLPLRRLGYMLRAARLGEPADAQLIKNLCQGIAGPEIVQPEKDLFGAYLCGTEFAYRPGNATGRWARIFLTAVAESDSPLAGPAALQLAELLQADITADKSAIAHWIKRASECNHSEILKKQKNGGKI